MKKIFRVTKTTRLLKIREILTDMFADVSDEALLEQYSLSWEQLGKIYSKLFFDQEPDHPVPVKQLLAHFEKYGAYKQLAVH